MTLKINYSAVYQNCMFSLLATPKVCVDRHQDGSPSKCKLFYPFFLLEKKYKVAPNRNLMSESRGIYIL